MAHSANVNCLWIGKKTCQLLLTGADNHKVNLQAVGKPTSLMVCSVLSIPFPTSLLILTWKFWGINECYCVIVKFFQFRFQPPFWPVLEHIMSSAPSYIIGSQDSRCFSNNGLIVNREKTKVVFLGEVMGMGKMRGKREKSESEGKESILVHDFR